MPPSQSNNGLWFLIASLTIFLVSGGGAIWLYFKSRHFWRSALDFTRGGRFVYFTVATVILPLLMGSWADLIDVSEFVNGNINNVQGTMLCLLAFFLVVYLYMQGCWIDREEYNHVQLTKDVVNRTEIDCQKNYLVRLFECLRACIGLYEKSLGEVATLSPLECLEGIKRISPLSNLKAIVEAVRRTYKTIETVPKDSDLRAVLFAESENYLVPMESFDGTNWGWFEREYALHKDYFTLSKPNASVAVSSVIQRRVLIVENAVESHPNNDHPFRYFFNDEAKQRDIIGSMIAIPFELATGDRWVLCLSCEKPNAFLEQHRWKAQRVKDELEARVRLMFVQEKILRNVEQGYDKLNEQLAAVTQRADAYQKEVEDTTCELTSLRHQLAELQGSGIADLNQLKQQLVDVETSAAAHSSNAAQVESKLRQELTAVLSQLESLKTQLSDSEEVNRQLNQELHELKIDLVEVETALERAIPKPSSLDVVDASTSKLVGSSLESNGKLPDSNPSEHDAAPKTRRRKG